VCGPWQKSAEQGFPNRDDAFDATVGLFGMLDVLMDRRTPSNARAASMSSRGLINRLPIPSLDADFLAADARELYRHANEPIFLLLIVGGEGVLVHDDYRGIGCAACPRKVWEHLFDSSR